MKKLILLPLLILFFVQAIAQTGSIHGVLREDSTKDSLPGGLLVLVGMSKDNSQQYTAVSDAQGKFQFVNLKADTYSLRATFVGYKDSILKKVIVQDGKTTSLVISMKEDKGGEEVVIIGYGTAPGESIQGKMRGVDIKRSSGETRDNSSNVRIRGTRSISTTQYLPPKVSEHNTEEYKYNAENDFKKVKETPLSTFSIDVDNASYSNVRRFINQGQLPPKDAVRVEEMINYFKYEYPKPEGETPFSIFTEAAPCPWNKENVLVQVGIKGKEIDMSKAAPNNLTFLIDVSGSMGDDIQLVKSSLKLLVEKMRPKDKIAIVVYAGAAGLVLPPTNGTRKTDIMSAIENLQAGGSTAGGEGILLAYKIAKENFISEGNNRILLATDGDFNVGVSSEGELVRIVEEKRQDGIFLTVLGFGMGNYNDSKMESLADKGNGNYYYIDNLLEGQKVLVNQLGGTLYTIAKDVKLQVEFNPAYVKEYRLVGYENRLLNKEDFDDDKKDAGELGAGHTVTALYEIVPVKTKETTEATGLRYQETKVKESAFQTNEMMFVKIRYKEPKDSKSNLITHAVSEKKTSVENCSTDFKFCTAVAAYAQRLKDSKYKGDVSYDDILQLARSSKGTDDEGYRAEFIRMVEMTKLLQK